jgi:hypothetical protein
VRVITRSRSRLPECARDNPQVSITVNTLLGLNDSQLAAQLDGCDVVVSCLGHNPTCHGIYRDGHFVRDTLKRVYDHLERYPRTKPLKYILMSSSLVSNPNEAGEKRGYFDRFLLLLLHGLLPPQRDNQKAAAFLRKIVGSSDAGMEWVVVRPELLTNIEEVTGYCVHPSPTTSLSTGGQTSRANTAHFLIELATQPKSWLKWKGKMPFIINTRDKELESKV